MPIFDFLEMVMKKLKEPEFFSEQVAKARRFYMDSSRFKNSQLQVICGGCEHTGPDFKIDRKDFPYYSIEFVASGSGTVILENVQYELGPGSIFSYGPGISQFITADSDKPMIKYFIDFTGQNIEQRLEKYISSIGTAVIISRPDEIATIFDNIITHGLSNSPYKRMICSCLLEYLIFRIAETVSQDNVPGRALLTYHNCRHYIKNNFITLNSLQQIADDCNIDHAYLCRLFKKYDTQSPYHYLMHLKMAYAAKSFQESDIMVKEIAFELGFDDPFHFTRSFKKVFGISPKAFKKLR